MILRNAAIKWGAGVVSLLVGIFTTPILVRYLGQEFFGVWLLFMGVSSYMNFLDLGMGTALTRHMAHDYAIGDWDSANGHLGTGLGLFSLSGLLVMVIYLCLATWGLGLFKLGPQYAPTVRACLLILGAAGMLAFPSRVSESVLAAAENYHVFGLVEIVSGPLRLGLIALVLGAGGHLLGLTLVHVGVLLGGYLVFLIMALRLSPKGLSWSIGLNRQKMLSLFRHGRHLLLYQGGQLSLEQGSTILLGALSNPATVAIYGVGNRINSMSTAISKTALDVSMARFSALDARGDYDTLRGLFLSFSLYAGLLAFYLGAGILVFAGPFINLWVGPQFAQSVWVIRLLVGPMILFLAVYPCFLLLVGQGRHFVCGVVHILEAALALGASAFAAVHWGAPGVAACVGGSLLLMRPWLFPWQACRGIGLGLGRYYLYDLARPGLAGVAALGLLWLLPIDRAPATWPGLILSGLWYSLLYAAAAWFFALGPRQRDYWKQLLAGWLPGGKDSPR